MVALWADWSPGVAEAFDEVAADEAEAVEDSGVSSLVDVVGSKVDNI